MVFSSLLFVLLFFAANIVSQAAVTDIKHKNMIMLGFSLVFYAWAGVRYLPLLAGMTLICWFFALLIERYEDSGKRKAFLAVCVTLVLIILGIFKYLSFFLTNVQKIAGVPENIPQIELPIGISFYTFQLLSYVIDVYRGDTKAQKKYWILLLYAGLFHQCIAGPIVRYTDINNDIMNRRVKQSEISKGITRFTVGLAKKAVLANGCAAIADNLLNTQTLSQTPACGIWLGAFAYMLEIYLDFSAYSDMAIGMGLMCGFHYKENFNYPYTADSVTDFWRRWHISLSSFFRDYVYIPLGGNRCSQSRQIFNLAVVWFLTGLWHGASWNYIIWGLYYLVFLIIEKFVWKGYKNLRPVIRRIMMLIVVYFGWIIFKFEDFDALGTALRSMFGLNANGFNNASVALTFKNNVFFLIFACVAVTPLGKYIKKLTVKAANKYAPALIVYGVFDTVIPLVLLVVSLMALAGDSYNPFLYFQF